MKKNRPDEKKEIKQEELEQLGELELIENTQAQPAADSEHGWEENPEGGVAEQAQEKKRKAA